MTEQQPQRAFQSWQKLRSRLLIVIVVALVAGLALSMIAMFTTMNGLVMIVLCVLWALAAGVSGARLRSWWWVAGCPGAMLGFVLLWELVYGRESWRSLYVFMLGVVFAASALVGAIPGVWLGKRQSLVASGRGKPFQDELS
jgi:hypothetical protein